jgi:hypothetical protein
MADCDYLTPLDLALLEQVFDEACARNKVEPDSPAASNLAKALMAAFEKGIQDKADLLSAVTIH